MKTVRVTIGSSAEDKGPGLATKLPFALVQIFKIK